MRTVRAVAVQGTNIGEGATYVCRRRLAWVLSPSATGSRGFLRALFMFLCGDAVMTRLLLNFTHSCARVKRELEG